MYVIIGGDIFLTEEDLSILLDSLKPATPKWRDAGLALGFLDHELATIEQKPLLIPEGPTGYFREMLSQWLKWAPPNRFWPTLEALQPALQSCGHEGLAVQLIPMFLQKKGILDLLQCWRCLYMYKLRATLFKNVLQNLDM